MTVLDFIASQQDFYQKTMSNVSNKVGLTSMELAILLFLANNPEYDTARDIIEKRHLTKSHVSTSIRSLEENGYVKKEYRNGDHRTCHLILLDKSQNAVKLGQKAQKYFLSSMTKGFSKEEMNVMKDFLIRIYDNVLEELSMNRRNKK